MRTDEEILARIEEIREDDFFGFQRGDLVAALPFDKALPFLTEEGIAKGPEAWGPPPSDEEIREGMAKYFPFALGKALGHRGLSAARSVDHYRAWTWLLGDEDHEAIDWDDFTNYGAPILRRIAERFEIEFDDSDEFANMSKGWFCDPGCMDGCGR